jgi:hypothetical protein
LKYIHGQISDEIKQQKARMFTKEHDILHHLFKEKALEISTTHHGKQRKNVPFDLVAQLMFEQLSREEFPAEFCHKKVLQYRQTLKPYKMHIEEYISSQAGGSAEQQQQEPTGSSFSDGEDDPEPKRTRTK